jgi:hypothetical protein
MFIIRCVSFVVPIAIFLAPFSAVAATDQFDLVCVDAKGKFSERLRIDLAVSEWCTATCDTINKIVEVSSGKLLLRDQHRFSARESMNIIEVNRITGQLRTQYDNGTFDWDITSYCSASSFSGIPGAAAKF